MATQTQSNAPDEEQSKKTKVTSGFFHFLNQKHEIEKVIYNFLLMFQADKLHKALDFKNEIF